MKYLFSVIVPIYNAEKYLGECIVSLINQSCNSPYEIVLIDDGSTDQSFAIAKKYADSNENIKIHRQENGGAASARAFGALLSEGEYILSIDSDDKLRSDALLQIENIVLEYKPDVIQFGRVLFSNDGFEEKKIFLPSGLYNKSKIEEEVFPRLFYDSNFCGLPRGLSYYAIRCELYKGYVKDVKIKIAEDAACSIPCLYYAQTLYVLNECILYVRNNPNSTTRSRQIFAWDIPKIFYSHINKYIDLQYKDFSCQMDRMMLHLLYHVVVSQFNDESSYQKIKRSIKNNLSMPLYSGVLNRVKTDNPKIKFVIFFLKHRIILPFWVMNKYGDK